MFLPRNNRDSSLKYPDIFLIIFSLYLSLKLLWILSKDSKLAFKIPSFPFNVLINNLFSFKIFLRFSFSNSKALTFVFLSLTSSSISDISLFKISLIVNPILFISGVLSSFFLVKISSSLSKLCNSCDLLWYSLYIFEHSKISFFLFKSFFSSALLFTKWSNSLTYSSNSSILSSFL